MHTAASAIRQASMIPIRRLTPRDAFSRRSNQPMARSSATAMTISAPVAERIRPMSATRMPRLMTLPSPPPPTNAANTAEPMALTTAMRTPVNTMGNASGNSTWTSRYSRPMPMPRAASFTPGSTS